MLTPDQKKYLQKIPPNKILHIKPFNNNTKTTAEQIIAAINNKLPELSVRFMGAAALRIAGQNDIDIHILSQPNDFHLYLPTLEKMFGKPCKQNPILIKWEFVQNEFEIELYLTDKNSDGFQMQEKTFELLQSDPKLRTEYENLKNESDGLPLAEYMRRKYEFFNKILSVQSL